MILHYPVQVLWGCFWKQTVGKRQITSASMHCIKQETWERIWIRTLEKKQNQYKQFDYISSGLSTLRTHLKRHSKVKSNKCNQCNFSSTWPTNLRTHLKMHSGEKSKNATNVIMHPLVQAIWVHTSKYTTKKSQTIAASVILHPTMKAVWGYIWKDTVKSSQTNATNVTYNLLGQPI